MLASKVTDHHLMNHEDDDDGGMDPPASEVPCSICLDSVSDKGDRSTAKLQCGHQFHLDCIGSAFNMKGAMQCPNCRKVEKGRWLYANGSAHPLPEFSMDDWFPEEDTYDLSYTEMPFRVHWCPFGRLAQVLSSFEEVEFPSSGYNAHQGHHAFFAEHSVSSSVANSYVPYFGPMPPSSLNSSNNVDDFNFNRQWNGMSGHNEILDPHRLSAIDVQFNTWGYHSPPLPQSSSHMNGVNPASVPPTMLRSTRNESDAIAMFRPFSHPFHVGHGSGPRAGSSFMSSVAPRHPGTNHWNQERIQIPHPVNQQERHTNSQGMPTASLPGVRRFDGQMGVRPIISASSQPDHSGGFYIFPPSSSAQNLREAENPLPNHIYAWERDRLSRFPTVTYERDSGQGSFHQGHQGTGGADFGNRSSSNFWHRH